MNFIYSQIHKSFSKWKVRFDFGIVFGAVLVFIGAVGFSTKAIFVKLAYEYPVDAISLLTLRMLFSLPFFVIVGFFFKNPVGEKLTVRDYAGIAFAGITGNYVAGFLSFSGLYFVTASMERLILFIYPTFIVLLSAFFLRKKVTKFQIIALVLTYAGIFIVFVGDLALKTKPDFLLGVLLILGSAFTYSIYLISSEKFIPKVGSGRFTSLAMFFSTIGVFIHFLIFSKESLFGFEPPVYFLSLALAIFSTVIPAFLISMGIKRIGASNTGIVASIGPISTIILAFIFLDEKIGITQLIGTFVVLTGVLLISLKGINLKTKKETAAYDL